MKYESLARGHETNSYKISTIIIKYTHVRHIISHARITTVLIKSFSEEQINGFLKTLEEFVASYGELGELEKDRKII